MSTRSLGTLTLDMIAKIGGFVGPMDKASRNAKKNSGDISKSLNSIAVAAGALGVGAAAGFAVLVKGSINAADELYKQSQIVGMSVEHLSALKFTAGEAGVEFNLLNSSLGKFNKNINDALGGTGPAFEAFSDLGITLKDNNGNLKSTSALFEEVAGAMSQLEDGAIKTALAQDLLGKGGKELIPLLNAGADGLRNGAEEAERLGQVMSTDAAAAAERLNDNLSRLQKSITGVANAAAMEAAPGLAEMTDILADPEIQQGIANIGKGLIDIGSGAIKALAELSNFASWVGEEIAAQMHGVSTDDVVRLEQLLDSLIEQRDKGFFTRASNYRDDGKLEAAIKQTQEQIEAAYAAMSEAALKAQGDMRVDPERQLSADLDRLIDGTGELTAEQIEARRAARATTEEQRKLREDANKSFEKMRTDLQKEIDLWSSKSDAVELAYELERGLIAGLDAARQKELVDLQKKIDLKKFYSELPENEKALSKEFDSIIDGDIEYYKKGLQETVGLTEDAFERLNQGAASMWQNFAQNADSALDGVKGMFLQTLSEMAHAGLSKPIIMNFQQKFSGGDAAKNSGQASQAAGAISQGGVYAAIAVAVVAGVNVWNKAQDEKFEKMTAEYRQGTQNIGSILGYANHKSDSVAGSAEVLAALAEESLGVNRGMLNALNDIRSGINDVASGFARQFGINGVGDSIAMQSNGTLGINNGIKRIGDFAVSADFLNYQKATGMLLPGVAETLSNDRIVEFVQGFMGGITDKISKNLYSKKSKILDSGIEFIGQSLADLLSQGAVDAFAYADVQTKKKTLGITTSNKVKTQTEDLEAIYAEQFGDVFAAGADILRLSSDVFGIEFDKYIDSLVIDPQKLSLKDLEGDEVAAEIEAFISKNLDAFSNVLLTGTDVLSQYQAVGEGAFETMVRLAGETASFTEAAELLNLKFSAVDMAAVDAVQGLADAAGGFDTLSGSLNNYANKFMDDSDRFADAQRKVSEQFDALGIAIPKTRDEFKALVENGVADPELFSTLMSLVGATDYYLTALEKQNKETADAAAAAEKLSESIKNELTALIAPFEDSAAKSGMSDFEASIFDINKSLTESIAKANELGATEQQLALIRGVSAREIEDLLADRESALTDFMGGFSDALAKSGLSEFEAQVYDLNKSLAASIEQAISMGATEQQLADIRSATALELAALEKQRADEIVELEKQRIESLESFMGSFKDALAKVGLSEFEAQVYDLNKSLAASIDQANTLGATEEQLALIRNSSALQMQQLYATQTDSALSVLRGAIDSQIEREVSAAENKYAAINDAASAAFENVNSALAAQIDSAGKWLDTQQELYDRQAQGIEQSINALSGLGKTLRDAANQMRFMGAAGEELARVAGLRDLDTAIAVARAGGAIDADKISGLIGNLQANESRYSTEFEYAAEIAQTAAKLDELAGLTDSRISIEERSIAGIDALRESAVAGNLRLIEGYSLNMREQISAIQAAAETEISAVETASTDQINELERQYSAFVEQIDVMRGIDKSVVTVADAIAQLQTAIELEQQSFAKSDAVAAMANVAQTNVALLDEFRKMRDENYRLQYQIAKNTGETTTILWTDQQIAMEEAG